MLVRVGSQPSRLGNITLHILDAADIGRIRSISPGHWRRCIALKASRPEDPKGGLLEDWALVPWLSGVTVIVVMSLPSLHVLQKLVLVSLRHGGERGCASRINQGGGSGG